jgi:hypothetical protein
VRADPGTPASPLFLVNHWLQSVSPESATDVHDAAVLADRIEELPLGVQPGPDDVDFARRGELVAVVDQLDRG